MSDRAEMNGPTSSGVLVAGTRAQVHDLTPIQYSPVIRRAMVDRCRRLGRGHFARAKAADSNADAEAHQADGRAWMREAKRWDLKGTL